MKDLEKTDVERNNSSKRMRRRKRKMNLYGLIVIILVLTVGITVCYTFLFNIGEIRVAGESAEYTATQIVEASGIEQGDNLLRLKPSKSEQAILDNLLYIETAVVDRDFPSSLNITVTSCVPAFNVCYENGTLLVSKKGKILADNGFITEGLPIFYGYTPEKPVPGQKLVSQSEHKSNAFSELCEIIESKEEKIITSVDMNDENNIIVNYSNDIIFKMGNWRDIEYKLNLAENIMNDENISGKAGYITMIGTNQCSFRTTDDPAFIPGAATEPTTENTTDINGNPVISPETTNSGSILGNESDDDAMFREHDESVYATEPNEEDDAYIGGY